MTVRSKRGAPDLGQRNEGNAHGARPAEKKHNLSRNPGIRRIEDVAEER